ncbi:hypothetical protein ACFL1A_03035 [Patescibacteria group bacterium]
MFKISAFIFFPVVIGASIVTKTGPDWLAWPMIVIYIIFIYLVHTDTPNLDWILRITQTILTIYMWVIFIFTLLKLL